MRKQLISILLILSLVFSVGAYAMPTAKMPTTPTKINTNSGDGYHTEPAPVTTMYNNSNGTRRRAQIYYNENVWRNTLRERMLRLKTFRNKLIKINTAEKAYVEKYREIKAKLIRARKANLSEEQKLNLSKEFAIAIIDRQIANMERVKALLEERKERLSELNKPTQGLETAIANIDRHIAFLQEKKQEIENASTLEEVREIAKETRDEWRKEKHQLDQEKRKAVITRASMLIDRLTDMGIKGQEIINNSDLSEEQKQELLEMIDNYMNKLNEISNKLEDIDVNSNDFSQEIREVVNDLKEVRKLFIEITHKYREYTQENLIAQINAVEGVSNHE